MNPGNRDPLFFFIFLLVLSVLSFFHPVLPVQVALIAGGLGIPLLWMVWRQREAKARETPLFQKDLFPRPSPWGMALFLAAALAIRFWGITDLLVWPQADEGFSGIAGIELSRHWDWRFFYSDGQSPPVLDWICSLFFRANPSYFFDLWVPPVLFSILTLLLGVWATRPLFTPGFAWLFGGLLAFTFWPLYLGRLCLQVVMFPPWELAAFWALGKYLNAPPASKGRSLALLGSITGLGAYTYVPWVFIPALFGGILFLEKGVRFRKGMGRLVVFGIFLCLGAVFFLTACVREGYGDHISNLWAGKPAFTWGHHLLVMADYLNVLFWGYLGEVPRYVPFQGGYLNPLLGALFLLGVAEAWKWRRHPWVLALGAAFCLFLLPGVLSTDVQGLRIVPLMPPVLFLAALGFQRLTADRTPILRYALAGLFMAASAGLDLFRLLQPYQDPSRYEETFRKIDKNPALYRGYGLLQAQAQAQGPGLLFTDFTPERDQTLRGATYPFNAAWKRELGPGNCRWAGFLVEKRAQALAERAFPAAQWSELGDGAGKEYGLVLGLVPITSANRELLLRWSEGIFTYFQGLSSAMNEVKNLPTYRQAESQFLNPPAEVRSNKFLAFCLEKRTMEFYDHFGRH